MWAALLIPSFVTSRREAPISTTESFARSTARLAAVQQASAEESVVRGRVRARRRHVLTTLVLAAASTLGVAIWTGSWVWLSISLIADALIAAYIAVLLQVRRSAELAALEAAAVPAFSEQPEVRVLAG